MATGKERGYKDWKLSKSFKRSARNFTEPDAVKGGKKNTRKWCKGKVGRKHTLALYNKYSWTTSHKCINCGKEIYGKKKREDFDYVEMRWEDFN